MAVAAVAAVGALAACADVGDGGLEREWASTARLEPPPVEWPSRSLVFGGARPVYAETPPPPLQGGTLTATRDGRWLIASDPERDLVHVVDADAAVERHTFALSPGDEPGRIAVDEAGRAHVALRGGGAVLTLDPERGDVLARRSVCGAPSGVAWSPQLDEVAVACVEGVLVRIPSDPAGEVTWHPISIAPDLRDVVADGDRLVVSTFRRAELFAVHGNRIEALHGAITPTGHGLAYAAWRLVALPGGGVLALHRIQRNGRAVGGRYGSTPSGDSRPGATSQVATTAWPVFRRTRGAERALVVDVAVDPRSGERAFAQGGLIAEPPWARARPDDPPTARSLDDDVRDAPSGRVAVAFTVDGTLWVQDRDPSQLRSSDGAVVPLAGEPVRDTGYDLFHLLTPSGFACATCHPGGGEDGQVWPTVPLEDTADPIRRTQTLRGPTLSTAPFHWSGDVPTFHDVVTRTMREEMGEPGVTYLQAEALAAYVDAIPDVPTPEPRDADTVARGREAFEAAGCDHCHSGDRLSNGGSALVRPGRRIQVPSLRGLRLRAPYGHDGSLATVEAVMDRPLHQAFAALSTEEQWDLLVYLYSL